jgi:hypothetical protein
MYYRVISCEDERGRKLIMHVDSSLRVRSILYHEAPAEFLNMISYANWSLQVVTPQDAARTWISKRNNPKDK